MKKTALVTLAVIMMAAICLPAFAQEFPDVPADHWAYQAIKELAGAGILVGYPDGTFGGKRAMTRYELAGALAKAIPNIAKMVQAQAGATGAVGPQGPAGPAGPQGPKGEPGITPEQLAKLNSLVTEFQDELTALGADVRGLKADIAALNDRLTAVENEQKRVRFWGEATMFARGDVSNTPGIAVDRDGRLLSPGKVAPDAHRVLANSSFFNDYEFGVKGRVAEDTTVNALIAGGNYLTSLYGAPVAANEFTLWNLYADAGVKLGPLGATDLVIGRQPFQLTPLTLAFVDPDSYAFLEKTDYRDYVFDGGRATFNISKIALTLFADKAGVIPGTVLDRPWMTAGGFGGSVSQLAGVRAVIGTPFNGNLGLTYYDAGVGITGVTSGRAQIFGGDLNATISGIGLSANYGYSKPDAALVAAAAAPALGTPGFHSGGDTNNAFDAKLTYAFGKLGIGGGYTFVQPNYFAPGYWNRTGRAVNLTNAKGVVANLSYAISNGLSLDGEAQFLQRCDATAPVTFREATDGYVGAGVVTPTVIAAGALDRVNYYRAGVKYALTSTNAVDLGWEQVNWRPVGGGADTKEQYFNIGLGHSFNANSSLKVLYQIIDYKLGGIDTYAAGTSYRGGVAGAQFQLKY